MAQETGGNQVSGGEPRGLIETPADIETERAVLGSLLASGLIGERLDGHEILTAEDFAGEQHKLIFRAVLELEDEQKPTDALSVGSWLGSQDRLQDAGGRYYLAVLEDVRCLPVNFRHWCETLADVTRHRRAAFAMARAVAGFRTDPEEAVDRLVEDLAGITDADRDELSEGFDPVAYMHSFDDSGRTYRLSTGLREWDSRLHKMAPGMHIIAARPSCGKSSLALGVLRHVGTRLNRGALLVSMEMSRREVENRIVSAETGIPLSLIQAAQDRDGGARFSADEHNRLGTTMQSLRTAPITILEKSAPNVRELAAICRRWWKMQSDPGVIIVDYLQLATGRGDTREQEVASVSRCCQAISMELNIPVVALSQLNRAIQPGQQPGLHNLRESGSLEQDADTVTFIHFEGEVHESTEAKLLVRKNRNGPCGQVTVRWDARRSQFVDHDGGGEASDGGGNRNLFGEKD